MDEQSKGFRGVVFGGFKREDVLRYIEETDTRYFSEAEELRRQLAEAQAGEETEGIIERICIIVAAELQRQGLSDETDPFLEAHCEQILDRIQEQRIRNMPQI